jgi:hypothetical protein
MRIDLIYHMIAGFVIATIITAFFPLWTGITLAVLAGVLKELYDLLIKKSVFDYKDLFATVFGGSIAFWFDLIKILKWN